MLASTAGRAAVGAAIALAVAAAPATAAPHGKNARYALAGGCYAILDVASDRYIREGEGGYRADADRRADAEPFRMQATDLGSYLLYGRDRDFAAVTDGDAVAPAAEPSPDADWRVRTADGAYRVDLPARDAHLAVAGDGRVVLGPEPSALHFEKADGCPEYPEVETNAIGPAAGGTTPFGEVRGFAEGHLHMMAFEFLGGRVRCGRPWHRYGAPYALVDCPDHYPANGAGAVLENQLSHGTPVAQHDPVGWPTFKDWPHHRSYTHEQVYYKWLERAHRSGLRLMVNLLVDNAVLCEVYPLKQNSCNEMDGVRLQATRINELQDYIDAQSGGPGKGWFRIVRSPFEARRVINDGKLAVVLGIEVSKLFDCGEFRGTPDPGCDPQSIDTALDEVHRMGVRQMELVNKFDNALSGITGDGGTTGIIVNNGNFYETGHWWAMSTCTGENAEHDHDKEQMVAPGMERDALVGGVLHSYVPAGTTPIYPEGPHCNQRGLTPLGAHLIRRMAEKHMLFDPDHMSMLARDQAMTLVEELGYPGVLSSHSWASPDTYARIAALDGVITPHAGSSTSFVEKWRATKALYDEGDFFGLGFGSDMNGFSAQGGPRGDAAQKPLTYPFKSFDGAVTIDRQRSGERVFDFNADGVAHYGMYADFVEDVRLLGGDEVVADMARGAEAYLRMWERALGIPGTEKPDAAIKRGATPRRVLRVAGQPSDRKGRTWRYRRGGRETVVTFSRRGRVASVRRSG